MSNFRREIYAARVEAAGPGLLRFEVHGQAFLWHMVRCLVAIIELVGDGLEAPDVVDALLDVARSPRRPQYALADEAPLVLHDCAFDTVRPAPTPEALLQLHEHLTRERHAARIDNHEIATCRCEGGHAAYRPANGIRRATNLRVFGGH